MEVKSDHQNEIEFADDRAQEEGGAHGYGSEFVRRFTYACPRSELAFKGTLEDAPSDPDGNIFLVIRRRHGAEGIIRAARRARGREWVFVLKHP